MKALALDTAISCISIAAKNDDNLASLVLDIGMRQSEKLLPAISYVMEEAGLEPSELDYTVLCEGPGSFTGLRLGFAALKALELFGGRKEDGQSSKIPLYAINSLDHYAAPFMDFDGIILPAIDAHKDKFYAKAFYAKKEILPCDDYELKALEEKILQSPEGKEADKIILCGLETKALCKALEDESLFKGKKILAPKSRLVNLESLFDLAEEKIARKEAPLADYDGPQYFRASEAELNQDKNKN
ncbi:MAG: tRNA (adenosine(37)-N6)-threonylcarbamoyltransferase complex dimerization subunit type 1 TsaB [Treponema sp.]|nr:tRNA (adenosine(37)-N6)-threonylcarbamoyltransferase complex dimerization subunit type 1 TsaB [Treponema sp.]